MRGRQILDASLIANEVVEYLQKRKEKRLVCKLDIEKAYDSINWNFLMKVLKKMGFGSRWMEWMWCVSQRQNFLSLLMGCQKVSSLVLRACVKEIPFLLIFLSWAWKC